MQEDFSNIASWSSNDFRAYAEYLNEWPLIEYTLRYIKDHLDLCGKSGNISQLVTSLVGQLVNNQASYFVGSFIDYRLGYNNGQAILLNEHLETSENIKYSTLNAAAEPTLILAVEALLLMCTQNAPDAERKTPLIISAQKGLAGAMQLFIERNIDKDARDTSGRTALHHAAENGWEVIIRLLVQQKADTRIQDNDGKIALHMAVEK
jgi:hypothetical protein